MIAPAAAQMAGDLHIEGNFGTALAVSIFVLAYGQLIVVTSWSSIDRLR